MKLLSLPELCLLSSLADSLQNVVLGHVTLHQHLLLSQVNVHRLDTCTITCSVSLHKPDAESAGTRQSSAMEQESIYALHATRC